MEASAGVASPPRPRKRVYRRGRALPDPNLAIGTSQVSEKVSWRHSPGARGVVSCWHTQQPSVAPGIEVLSPDVAAEPVALAASASLSVPLVAAAAREPWSRKAFQMARARTPPSVARLVSNVSTVVTLTSLNFARAAMPKVAGSSNTDPIPHPLP